MCSITPAERKFDGHVDFTALAGGSHGGAQSGVVPGPGSKLGIGAAQWRLATRIQRIRKAYRPPAPALCDEEEMGRLFKVDFAAGRGLARGGRVQIMTVAYRKATAADARERWPSLERTFTHLRPSLPARRPRNLPANHAPEHWEKELIDPAFKVGLPSKRAVGRLCKLGPAALAVRAAR
jgi:hypothetical protein